MKKALISAVILVSIFGFSLISHKFQQPKTFKVELNLPLSDYQALLSSITQSDAFTAHHANELYQLIVTQLQPQIAQANKEDSINQAKLKANQNKK